MARIREQLEDHNTGRLYWHYDGSTSTYVEANNDRVNNVCQDVVEVGNGGTLTINKRSSTLTDLHGVATRTAKSRAEAVHYRPEPLSAQSVYCSHLPLAGRPSDSALAAMLLKRANPSRPVVDLPVFIAELRELPDLVRREGGRLIKQIAKGNLKYQFGIRPLVSDLQSMLNFQDMVDKRFRELKALQNSGLRRKMQLWNGSSEESGRYALYNLTNQPCRYDVRRITTQRVWGFVKYKAIPGKLPESDQKLRALAVRATFGLTLDASTAWELMPWSWLIDYFTSVGDYLQSSRNIVPVMHDTPQIMATTLTIARMSPSPDNAAWMAPLTRYTEVTQESKTRRRASATPFNAHLPLLSLRQMSILASLYVTKSGRY